MEEETTGSKNKRINIIITDDKPLYRQSIRQALEERNIFTIAEAANGKELIKHLETLKPDVILLDLRMPEMNGNETMTFIGKNYPKERIIVVSFHDERVLMEDYMLRGARGYISKQDISRNMDFLVEAIKTVHSGRKYEFHNEVKPKKLTPRQKEIIAKFSEGRSKKQIAENLGLTSNAVYKQEAKIMKILGVNTKEGLFSSIFEMGLNFLGRQSEKKKIKSL